MLEYAFPSLALLLQSALGLVVDRRANGFDLWRAFLLAPSDLAFLSVSIAAISMARLAPEELAQNVWLIPVVLVTGVLALILAAVIKSRTNSALDTMSKVPLASWVALGFGTSIALLWGALNLGDFV